jgi:hypothetical protein
MSEQADKQDKPSPLDEWCDEREISVLRADGFDDCIIGVSTPAPSEEHRVVYDADRIIKKLADSFIADGMGEDEAHGAAVEHFEYNIAGAYVGPQTPIYVIRITDQEHT